MKWLVALCVLVGLAGIASAKPKLELAARDGRVTVYAESGLEGTAADLAHGAEAALSRIADDLMGLPTPKAIEVRLVRDASDLNAIAPPGRGAPDWAVGVAYPDLGIVLVAMRKRSQFIEPITTLKHELAHIALGTALGHRAPRWLHEGFAYQHSAEWSRERIETLTGMAWFGNVIPLGELERSFPHEELVAHRAYAESYDFVGFLSRRGRWEDAEDDGDRYPFRRFLRDIGLGATPDEAAVKAFGRPLGTLFEEWKSDLARRYQLVPIGLLGLGLWILCALLLCVAWIRRRRQNRTRMAVWESEEAKRRELATQVTAPPYVPWPGEDPFDDEPDDDRPNPRLMN